MYEFKLPDLGEGVHEGELLKWHVEAGSSVEVDAPLCDVETDKAAVTIPSPRGGSVVTLGGKVGDTLRVGAVIAVIDDGSGAGQVPTTPAAKAKDPGAAPAASAPAASATAATTTPPTATPATPPTTPPATPPTAPPTATATPPPTATPGSGRPVPAAPATRRLARELGVDLSLVPATGPAGRVTPEDVQRFAQAQTEGATTTRAAATAGEPPTTARAVAEFAAHAASAIPFLDIEPLPDFEQWGPVEREPLRSIRRKVAHKMVTSMILVPHVAHMDEADVTELEDFRQREKHKRAGQPGGRLTLLPFVVKAVTAGLRAAPAFNASLDPFKEELIYKKFFNIGIAADTGRGLVVPVVKDTDRKSIVQIAAEIVDLATRARDNKLEAPELRGGTFTITNVGPIGGTALIPAINYPEVAILGMGRVQEKPVVRDGQIVIRKLLPLTLAFDHRVADGADAARFVTELVRQLSDPNLLLLET